VRVTLRLDDWDLGLCLSLATHCGGVRLSRLCSGLFTELQTTLPGLIVLFPPLPEIVG
jgi:hypothetical protein